MDLIYEAYQDSVIEEGFKSSTLTKLFKNLKTKMSRTYSDEEYTPDKQFYKNTISSMRRFLNNSASEITDADIEEFDDPSAFRKKANKINYTGAIFIKDGFPVYIAEFEDGKINYVSKLSYDYRNGNNQPNLAEAISNSDSVIAIADFTKYVKMGSDTRNARYASRRDAAWFNTDKSVRSQNIARYTNILAAKKAEDVNLEGARRKLIAGFNDIMTTMGKMDFTADSFKQGNPVQKMLRMAGMVQKRIVDIQTVIDNVGKTREGYWDDTTGGVSAKALEKELVAIERWTRAVEKFAETGEIPDNIVSIMVKADKDAAEAYRQRQNYRR